MKKIIIITLLLLSLTACGYINSRDELNENYRAGTEGLVLDFMTNVPPSTLYDDETFNVILYVYNRGATDINLGSNSRVFLSGFDRNIISEISPEGELIEDLEGKNQYNKIGDTATIDFKSDIRDLESRNIDNYDFTLLATACFDYTTKAEPTVCIDPDPNPTTSKDKACYGNTNPSLGSQGAPIEVSSVDVESLRGKTRFRITIRNVGGGTVFKDGFEYLTYCNPYDATGLEYTDIDTLTVTKVEVSNTDIKGTCKPMKNDEIRLTNGVATLICEYGELTGPAYTTPLRIQLDYGYRTSIQKQIEIISTP